MPGDNPSGSRLRERTAHTHAFPAGGAVEKVAAAV